MKRFSIALIIFLSTTISSFAYQYGAVTATGSAGIVVSASKGRVGLVICNNDTSTKIFLGLDSSVTSSTGLTVAAGTCFSGSAANEVWKGVVYVVTAGSSIDVRFLEYGSGDIQQ